MILLPLNFQTDSQVDVSHNVKQQGTLEMSNGGSERIFHSQYPEWAWNTVASQSKEFPCPSLTLEGKKELTLFEKHYGILS